MNTIPSPEFLSVVIPAYNSSGLLRRCLEALERQSSGPEAFEVIVVDDGSSDDTPQMLAELQKTTALHLRSIRILNAGPGQARNAGVAEARSTWIGLMDADVQAHVDWVQEALRTIKEHPEAGAIEGRTVVNHRELITPFTHQTENFSGGRYPTCNLLVRKAFCRFEPTYRIPFREDSDLAFSILEGGFPIIFAPDLIIYHPPLEPHQARPYKLAQRYFYDGYLRQRFPWRYANKLDVHTFGSISIPNLKKKGYGLIVLLQLAIATSLLGGPESLWLTLLLSAGYLAGTALGYALMMRNWDLKHWGKDDLWIYFKQIHILPWIASIALLRGRWIFRNTLRFSRNQWWEASGLGPAASRPRDIVLIATADWEHPFWTNKQRVAQLLARAGHRILYVESLGLRQVSPSGRDLSRIFKRLKRAFQGVRDVEPNIFVWSPLVLPFHRYEKIAAFNRNVLHRSLRKLRDELCFENALLWSYNPLMLEVAQKAGFTELVYHCVDELKAAPKMPVETLAREEERFCKAAQLVITTAPELQRTRSLWNHNTHYLPNPGDFAHFHSALEVDVLPEDLRRIPQPRLGFIGALSSYKVDEELLLHLAKTHPEWNLVLIGQIGEGEPGSRFEKLTALSNVFFLGPRPYEVLPTYLAGTQVALLPCPLNDYTRNMFPLKFFEYLAAGVPVVSTALPALQAYRNACYWCTTPEEVCAAIEDLLAHPRKAQTLRERGFALARENTWEKRVASMRELITQTFGTSSVDTTTPT
jgi:glycosyltransferase involved in cell wall biosynthesis